MTRRPFHPAHPDTGNRIAALQQLAQAWGTGGYVQHQQPQAAPWGSNGRRGGPWG